MHLRSSAVAVALCALVGAAPAAAADPPLTVPRPSSTGRSTATANSGREARALLFVTGTGATGERATRSVKAPSTPWPPGLRRRLPRLHDRRHPGLRPVPGLRDPGEYRRSGRRRDLRDQPGRPAAALRAHLLAEPAADGHRRPRRRRHPARHHPRRPGGCSARIPARRPSGSRRPVQPARGDQPQPFEAPGPTAWTTVRSAADEAVQPQTGPHPTSALKGATNILIQAVCPGRDASHIGTAFDSVTFAAFADALATRAPRGSRACPRVSADTHTPPASTSPARTRSSARAATSSRRAWSARCRGWRPSPR